MVDRFTSQDTYAQAEKVDLYDFLPSYVRSKEVNEICSIYFSPDVKDLIVPNYPICFPEDWKIDENAHCFVYISKRT